MPTMSQERTISALDVSFTMDCDDPSLGEIKFLTEDGWRAFQVARGALKALARDMQEGLRSTIQDQPEG